MQLCDFEEFGKNLVGIGELYGKEISEYLANIYWKALEKYELEDVEKAFNTHVVNPDGGQFMPKPADIVKLIEGSGETKALEAWAKAEKTIRSVGSSQSVAFDDGLIHAVIEDMGGWERFCSGTEDELPFKAREFQKRYMGFVTKPPLRYPPYLPGWSERNNNAMGYVDFIKPPVLIGDREKAEKVKLNGGGAPLLVHDPYYPKSVSAEVKMLAANMCGYDLVQEGVK